VSGSFAFVLVMGIVNLFADVSYEGGASINGPFLTQLGLGAAGITVVAGVGETLGYGIRSIAGHVADRSGRYWLVTFVGYAVNLLAVPAMALADGWVVAALFVFLERIGRAIRKPTVEAMLSYAAGEGRRGWVYALNNALDETGAMLGPVLMALALSHHWPLRQCYAWLLASSVGAMIVLAAARMIFPVPAHLEPDAPAHVKEARFTRAYWLTMAGGSLFGAGMTTYELASVHLASVAHVAQASIPLWLAFGTAVAALSSLALGKLYDRASLPTSIGAVIASALFAPVFFLGSGMIPLLALGLLGVAYATQDSLFKSMIAGVMPRGRRGAAFGVFYLGYGGGWLVGSIAIGLLYDHARPWLAAFVALAQLGAIPFFWLAAQERGQEPAVR
jgi:MFS family permease